MITAPVLANTKDEKTESDAMLTQAEFFLFLADTIDVEGELTTPLDLEHIQVTTDSDELPHSQTTTFTEEGHP